MSQYSATIQWNRGDARFVGNEYSRAHEWQFDGGATVKASASPQIVPEPHAVAANVDPEEAFVASVSSCHMLFFLSLAAAKGIVVNDYQDEATGIMKKDSHGKTAIIEIILRPAATYQSAPPARAELEALHASAHQKCFIANSIRSSVSIELVS